MRPSWNGHLRLSLVSCPIGLVPATTEVERIKLNQLNPATGNRISLQPVDSETGEKVERSEIVKGYKLEGDQYVILEPAELKELQVEILPHPRSRDVRRPRLGRSDLYRCALLHLPGEDRPRGLSRHRRSDGARRRRPRWDAS